MLNDRILYYDYFAEVAGKMNQEIGEGVSLTLSFIKFTKDPEPKIDLMARFEVKPENKDEIDRYFNTYVYSEENLNAKYKQYQCTHAVGCAIPPDKAPIYTKIVNDYLR